MTIPEACQLILQAGALGRGGEIFVLDMGQPVKVTFLAEQMIKLVGKMPRRDIDIVYTGLRPGEKLHEELFHVEEKLSQTAHQKILLAVHRQVEWEWLCALLSELQQHCTAYDEHELLAALQRLVPELHEELEG